MSRYCSVIKAVGLSLLLGLVGPGAFAKQAESLPPIIAQLMPAARHSSLDQTIMQFYHSTHARRQAFKPGPDHHAVAVPLSLSTG